MHDDAKLCANPNYQERRFMAPSPSPIQGVILIDSKIKVFKGNDDRTSCMANGNIEKD